MLTLLLVTSPSQAASVQLEVSDDAAKSIDAGITNVAVTHRVAAEPAHDLAAAEVAVEVMTERLGASPRFTGKNVGATRPDTAGATAPGTLEADYVTEWCGDSGLTGMISLESLHLGVDEGVERIEGGVGNQTFDAWWLVEGTATWRLYACETGDVVDELILDVKTLDAWRRAAGPTPAKAKAKLPSVDPTLEALARKTAQRYADRVAPSVSKVTREVYFNGKDLKGGEALVNAGDWDAAIDLWMNVQQNGKATSRARAAHNLAVASERYGQIDEALKWLDTSLADLDAAPTRGYRFALERRKKDQAKRMTAGDAKTEPQGERPDPTLAIPADQLPPEGAPAPE